MALMTDLDDRIKLTVENRGSNEWSVDFKKTRVLAIVESLIYCIQSYAVCLCKGMHLWANEFEIITYKRSYEMLAIF